MVDTLRHWAKTIIKWNLVLDEKNGPKIPGGCDTCYGVVTLNQSTRQVSPRPHYYALSPLPANSCVPVPFESTPATATFAPSH
jgi:hypothetical protein